MGSTGPTHQPQAPATRRRAESSASAASSADTHPTPSSSQTPMASRTSQSWGQPPRAPLSSGSASRSNASGSTTTPTPRSERARSDESNEETRRRKELRNAELSQLSLIVCQQPERARLCSFKEENETIDRRPVDPPPVIELKAGDKDYPELLDSTSFFIRASLVAAEPTPTEDDKMTYATVKTPTGADVTAGEVIQTPERLRHLDGKPGALCIFAKLSVRLPGVFRLKFTLYETAKDGITEITHTISEPFEVFSPKLFKGMHESTPLTRHLATQGLKVKLRTDLSGGKATGRRRSNVASTSYSTGRKGSDAELSSRPSSSHEPLPRHIPGQSHLPAGPQYIGQPPQPPARGLVWHSAHHSYPQYPEYDHPPVANTRQSPRSDEPARKLRRTHDDGMFALTDISSRLDFSLPSPSSDLSAFSLGNRRPQSASAAQPPYSRREWDHQREYSRGDDGLPSLVLSPSELHRPPSAPGGMSHNNSEFALPRLPRIVPGSSGSMDRPPDRSPRQHHAPPQHSPHMPQHSPHMPQHSPYLPQHSPHMPQYPHVPHHGHYPPPYPNHPQHAPHPQHQHSRPRTTPSSPPPTLPPIREAPWAYDRERERERERG